MGRGRKLGWFAGVVKTELAAEFAGKGGKFQAERRLVTFCSPFFPYRTNCEESWMVERSFSDLGTLWDWINFAGGVIGGCGWGLRQELPEEQFLFLGNVAVCGRGAACFLRGL